MRRRAQIRAPEALAEEHLSLLRKLTNLVKKFCPLQPIQNGRAGAPSQKLRRVRKAMPSAIELPRGTSSASNNSHAFAGFCGLFDCGKGLMKSNRIIKTRRSAGSVTQIIRHQPVHARNVAGRYSVFEAKVKRRR